MNPLLLKAVKAILPFILGGVIAWALLPASDGKEKRAIKEENAGLRKEIKLLDQMLKKADNRAKAWEELAIREGDSLKILTAKSNKDYEKYNRSVATPAIQYSIPALDSAVRGIVARYDNQRRH